MGSREKNAGAIQQSGDRAGRGGSRQGTEAPSTLKVELRQAGEKLPRDVGSKQRNQGQKNTQFERSKG